MGLLTGVELRNKRASSWKDRAKGDLDTQFIFLWIAFNALYGQAHYRNPDAPWSEIGDIRRFLGIMRRLDRRITAIPKEEDVKSLIAKLLTDKYLHDCCWRVGVCGMRKPREAERRARAPFPTAAGSTTTKSSRFFAAFTSCGSSCFMDALQTARPGIARRCARLFQCCRGSFKFCWMF